MPLHDTEIITELSGSKFDEALRKVADRVNARENAKLALAYANTTGHLESNARERALKLNTKGQGAAKWRKIAEIPEPVHRFFVKEYAARGMKNPERYFEDPDWIKTYPEWATLETWEL